jgi:2-methylcitrate dehydratase PrpD
MPSKTVSAPITEDLAKFSTGLTFAHLPSAVIEKTLIHILDGVGCAAIGTLLPWIRQVSDYALDAAKPGGARVIGGQTLVPEWAAFVNATSAHGFELDDYHSGALAHPGCVIVPTVLAIAQEQGTLGQEAIVACALGMEAIVRIGRAVAPSMVVDRGFHETCTQGVFGAALVASRLMNFNVPKIVSALGIAGSHASGTRQYSHTGGEVKRLHAGLGAMGGIRSASLAGRGFQGPLAILEGNRGFLQAFANEYDQSFITSDLGERWDFLDCGIKPHASCGLIHAPTDALSAILSQHSLKAADITEVVVGADRLSLEHVGSLPLLPQDMNGAQFNLPYSLGMIMAGRGSSFSSYWRLQGKGFDDKTILDAGKLVRMELDPEIDAVFPQVLKTRVRVHTTTGQWFEHVTTPIGSKDSPLRRDQVEIKFRNLLSQTPWSKHTENILAAIGDLEDNVSTASTMKSFEPVIGE